MAELLEHTQVGACTVDRDAGLIRGVKIIGKISKNGRTYSDNALREGATLYEGKGVNIDHPDKRTPGAERRLADAFGRLRNVIVKDDGVYGDLDFLKSHPLAESICEAAERMPEQLGLSHNAQGRVVGRGSESVVEAIESVRSVDLVRNPATVAGLFESADEGEKKMPKRITLREMVAAMKPGPQKVLLLEMEGELPDGEGVMATEVEAPAEDANADDQVKAAFRGMVIAAFDDDSLDSKATLAKIKEILAAQEKLTSGGEAAKSDSEESKPAETTESVLEIKRELAKDLLESLGVDATKVRVEALATASVQVRKELLEAWKPKQKAPRPARSTSVMESESTDVPKDSKSFASMLRG